MNGTERISVSFKVLTEIHQKISFADSKASFVVTIDLALFAALVPISIGTAEAGRTLLTNNLASGVSLAIYSIILFVNFALIVLSLAKAIRAIYPRLSEQEKDNSLLYFGAIATSKREDFKNSYKNGTQEDMIEDVANQIYENSMIAKAKFESVGQAAKYLVYSIGVTGILAIGYFLISLIS